MALRNPIKDKVAIVGVGSIPQFTRDSGRSIRSLTLQACRNAVLDAGLTAKDIDGIAGSQDYALVMNGLGIPEVSYFSNESVPFAKVLASGADAVFSGECTTALLYHANYKLTRTSHSAANDPFRVRAGGAGATPLFPPIHFSGAMARHMHDYGTKREHFGMLAINARTNASKNPRAVMQTPITMDDYLSCRFVEEPMCLFDMDVPCDLADAFVITTAERAKDLKKKPVYIHATARGQTRNSADDQIDLEHNANQLVAKHLWGKSDFTLKDVDLFYPYDGFTILCLTWLEDIGFCKKGEAGPFLEQHWDRNENRVKINGKMPFNTHGGNHSEGAMQGSGHVREAVHQLRGEAGPRQVPYTPHVALLPLGGMAHFVACGAILQTT